MLKMQYDIHVQAENIEKLRNLVEDLDANLSDFDLLRWLQGYDNDFDKIVPQFRAHLRLMKSWDYENYERHPVVYKHYPYGLLGNTGVDNNLVYVECVGRIDGNGILKSAPITQFMRTRVHDMEIMMKALKEREAETGKQCKFVYVVDFDEMKYDSVLISLIKGRFKSFHDYFTKHYVEVFAKFVIVNVPSFGSLIFQALNRIMPEKTRQKLVVLGSDWKTAIGKHVTKDALPVHWGGSMVDETGNVMFRSKIVVPPGTVPEDDYWTPEKAKYASDELSVLRVPSGNVEYVTFRIVKIGSKLEWYFTTDGCWSFGAYFSESESEYDSDAMTMVFPDFGWVRFATMVPEHDTIVCDKPGFYKLKFDNQKAWFSTLTVNYKVVVHDA